MHYNRRRSLTGTRGHWTADIELIIHPDYKLGLSGYVQLQNTPRNGGNITGVNE